MGSMLSRAGHLLDGRSQPGCMDGVGCMDSIGSRRALGCMDSIGSCRVLGCMDSIGNRGGCTHCGSDPRHARVLWDVWAL